MLCNNNIDKDLVPIKAHYFLYSAGTGPLVVFLPLIAKQLGFSGLLVGGIYFILPISGLIAKPLFGLLADRFKLHKILFILFQAILSIAFLSFYFIPEIQIIPNVNTKLSCNDYEMFIKVCPPNGEYLKETTTTLDDDYNKIGRLQLSCDGSSNIYNELCNDWKENEYCSHVHKTSNLSSSSSSSSSSFNFTGKFNMTKNLLINKCLEIKFDKIFMSSINQQDEKINNEINWKIPKCNTVIGTMCNASLTNVTTIKKMLIASNNNNNNDAINYQFYLFLWAALISWIGMAVVVVIADAICLDILGENKRDCYGNQKLWSSIGFGVFGIISGLLVDLLSKSSDQKDYSCIFYGMLITMILDMIISTRLNKKSNDPTVENDPSVLWEIGSIIKETRIIVFGFWCIGAGMCTGVVWNFLLWHTENLMLNDSTWKTTLLSLMTGIQCFIGEVPFNFYSGILLKKLGHMNCMSIILLVYAIRFMAYSLIENAWIYLFIEILHGPTTGLTWPVMVMYGDKVAPSGIRATMQGFIGAIFEGVGVATGSLVGGFLMENYGGTTLFKVFSIGALVWLSIYWILQLLLRQMKSYPLQQGHSHLASYATPSDAIIMTMSQELETY